MEVAYEALQAALAKCQEAVKQGAVISGADAKLMEKATKEISTLKWKLRVQKVVKWFGWAVAIIMAYLAVQQATK